jgi:hypothetical protein
VNVVPRIFDGENFRRSAKDEIGGKPIAEIRSAAMEFLGIPLNASFGKGMIRLPFVTQQRETSIATDNVKQIFTALELANCTQKKEIFLHKSGFLPIMHHDLYTKENSGANGYGKVLAYPVYENGVIFSNFIDGNEQWQKGLIMDLFLSNVCKTTLSQSLQITGIDDSLHALKDMENQCHCLGLSFLGIHLKYMEGRQLSHNWPIPRTEADKIFQGEY